MGSIKILQSLSELILNFLDERAIKTVILLIEWSIFLNV
jgi:hypothetical protein